MGNNTETLISLAEALYGYKMTDEQKDIAKAFIAGKNIYINAGPGTGKSATITMLSIISSAMGNYNVNLAFNVKIMEKNVEAYKRFSVNGICWTTHAFADLVARTSVNYFKFDQGYKWKQLIKGLGLNNQIDEEKLNIILANCPFDKRGNISQSEVERIGQIFFGVGFDENTAKIYTGLLETIIKSVARGNYLTRTEVGIIPTLYRQVKSIYSKKAGQQFPIANVVFLDEALDSTISTIEQIYRYNPNAQIVFVGDNRQQIYNWAGAYPFIAEEIDKRWNVVRLPLSITFRCKSAIVEYINNRIVPDFDFEPRNLNQLPLSAMFEGGSVEFASTLSDTIPEIEKHNSVMVLERKNANALQDFMELIFSGIECNLLGLNVTRDLNLLFTLASKIDQSDLIFARRLEYLTDLIKEIALSKEKSKQKDALGFVDFDELTDAVSTIVLLFQLADMFEISIETQNDLYEFVESLEHKFSNAKCVVSTTHKIKGEEAELVIMPNFSEYPYRFKTTSRIDYDGELAVLFVSLSRAIDKLILVG